MPELNQCYLKHEPGKRICTHSPQDPCSDYVFVNPMTGIPARLANSLSLPQIPAEGNAFSVGTRKLNEKTNRHSINRRVIPNFNKY